MWHYATNFSNYLQPLPDLDEISRDVKLFHDHGVVGLFYEGDYAPGGGGDMAELKSYLLARLMWDPSQNPQAIISEFLRAVYGPAARDMQRWLDLVHEEARTRGVHAGIFDPPTAPYLTAQLKNEGEKIFDRAPHVSLVCGSASYTRLPEMLVQLEAGSRRVTGLSLDTEETFDTPFTRRECLIGHQYCSVRALISRMYPSTPFA